MNNQLQIGQRIIFSKIPGGSYLKPKITYLIEDVTEKHIWFRDEQTKGGTYDRISDVENSKFEIV